MKKDNNTKLLKAAQDLFREGHRASPFMTLNSRLDGYTISMRFKNLKDSQAVYSALVLFWGLQREKS